MPRICHVFCAAPCIAALAGARRGCYKTQMGKVLDKADRFPGPVPHVCEACLARHKGLCGALDVQQLQRLSAAARKRHVEPGMELLAEQEPASTFANILSGVVKLTKMLPDGRRQIVGLQFAPDFLGRPFAPDSAVGAQAVTVVELCTFPRSVIEQMITESPDLDRKLLAQALAELDEARDLILALGRKTAQEKLASFLLLLASHVHGAKNCMGSPPHGAHQPMTLDLPLTRGEIADFLGLTIETVSRQLTKLKGLGIIALVGTRRLVIHDVDRLAELTGD